MPNNNNAGDNTIKSSAVEIIQSLIGPNIKIHSMVVHNRHLVAYLTSGVTLRVLNE